MRARAGWRLLCICQSQEGLLGKVNCPAQSSSLVDRLFVLLDGLGVCHQACACLHISSRSLADMAWNQASADESSHTHHNKTQTCP